MQFIPVPNLITNFNPIPITNLHAYTLFAVRCDQDPVPLQTSELSPIAFCIAMHISLTYYALFSK